MAYPEYIKNITDSKLKTGLLIIFLLFIITPVEIPHFVSNYTNSFLGILTVIFITIYLFLYISPVLGFVYIFVGYKLLQQNNYYYKPIYKDDQTISNVTKDEELQKLNPPHEKTLEEQMIESITPLQYNISPNFSSYVPVYSKIQEGSSLWQ